MTIEFGLIALVAVAVGIVIGKNLGKEKVNNYINQAKEKIESIGKK